jgi:hypothetical protein
VTGVRVAAALIAFVALAGCRHDRSRFADEMNVSPETPDWVLELAQREARTLGDPRPDRLTIEAGEASFVIVLEGDFVCERCSGDRASRVRLSVGKASRRLDSLVVEK